jgi:hypothetical protein
VGVARGDPVPDGHAAVARGRRVLRAGAAPRRSALLHERLLRCRVLRHDRGAPHHGHDARPRDDLHAARLADGDHRGPVEHGDDLLRRLAHVADPPRRGRRSSSSSTARPRCR